MSKDIVAQGRSRLHHFDECPMLRRHVIAHFLKIATQHIFGVRNSKRRVERWYDRALRASLAAKALPYTAITLHAFVNHPSGQSRVIGPSVYVGPYPPKVDVRVAPFGHAEQDLMHRFERPGDGRQLDLNTFRFILNDSSLSRNDRG